MIMKNEIVDISVIIPQRNSLKTLPRLFNTIPEDERVEILLVDNSPTPITKKEIGINRDYSLLWCPPTRFAGGARNVGIENAKGKWLVFSDADDYFTENAFDTFKGCVEKDSDVIYFCADGIYPETGEPSSGGVLYTTLVKEYLANPENDWAIRTSFHVPWAKMVRREFVIDNNIRYDEVIANNDDYFSLLSGFYAKKIAAVDVPVYVYTVQKGSLMHRRGENVMMARYGVALRCNQFKREHGLASMQRSVMFFIAESRHYGIRSFFKCVRLLFIYHQNPFIGAGNWIKTFRKISNRNKKDSKYYTK